MAMRKIDIWKKVKETEIPDKLTVDPLDVLYFDRQELIELFDEQDASEHGKWSEIWEASRSKLDATLNEEQKYLYDMAWCDFNHIIGVENMSAYKSGFRDGVLLMFRTILRASLDGHGKDLMSEITDRVLNPAK